MSAQTENGYLVISDISGFTSYVAQTELEHSQEVLTELLELIVTRVQPLLKLVKLEGDAVFAHAPGEQVSRSENLLELIEATYVAFRNRVEGIVQNTTCTCNACRAIPMLDLKFLVHFGSYMIQNVSGVNDLVGSDVNLVHRLTKNNVTEATGWNAYALFTEACLQHMRLQPDGMHEQVETYEHLGDVKTFTLDLLARYKEIVENRQAFISSEEADVSASVVLAVPSSIAWDWMTDPYKRNRYMPGTNWSAVTRPGGRTGVGASNHCAHGEGVSVENILDWRPFEYYTTESIAKINEESPMDNLTTYHLEAGPDGLGTQIHMHLKLKKRNLIGLMFHKVGARQMKKLFRGMEQMILEEMAQGGVAVEPDATQAFAAAGSGE